MTTELLSPDSHPPASRRCGTCTLCCKVCDVPVLKKPAGKWCPHCNPGRGCAIHETRPDHCRAFQCLWIVYEAMGPEWKPERCHFVMTIDPATGYTLVQVDPGQPAAWKKHEYYSKLKIAAANAAEQDKHVIVFVNRHATVLFPDRDEVIGILAHDERINIYRAQGLNGPVFQARKEKAA